MKSRETLNHHESLRSANERVHEISHEHTACAERMYASRASMLESLGSHIGGSLYEALAKKIEHERTTLLGMFAREEKVTAEKRRLDKVLRTEYFVYRRLDIHVL